MIQEIISYAIIGGAFSVVALKSLRVFVPGGKMKKNSKCASCPAECSLRDAVENKNKDACVDKAKLNIYL